MVKYEPEQTVKRLRGFIGSGQRANSREPIPFGSATEYRRQVAYETAYTYPLKNSRRAGGNTR